MGRRRALSEREIQQIQALVEHRREAARWTDVRIATHFRTTVRTVQRYARLPRDPEPGDVPEMAAFESR